MKGRTHSEETKAKLRAARYRQLARSLVAEGKMPRPKTPTSIRPPEPPAPVAEGYRIGHDGERFVVFYSTTPVVIDSFPTVAEAQGLIGFVAAEDVYEASLGIECGDCGNTSTLGGARFTQACTRKSGLSALSISIKDTNPRAVITVPMGWK